MEGKKLQALIVADSFENKFVPLSNPKTPQCLFPVANVPNLHYIIEFLMMNSIKEIIVTCRHNFREVIRAFVKSKGY